MNVNSWNEIQQSSSYSFFCFLFEKQNLACIYGNQKLVQKMSYEIPSSGGQELSHQVL